MHQLVDRPRSLRMPVYANPEYGSAWEWNLDAEHQSSWPIAIAAASLPCARNKWCPNSVIGPMR